jgi:hypothetical protein
MASFHRVFGHPHHDGKGGELAPREFTMQRTDYKSVVAYSKFSGDYAWDPILVIVTTGVLLPPGL